MRGQIKGRTVAHGAAFRSLRLGVDPPILQVPAAVAAIAAAAATARVATPAGGRGIVRGGVPP
eukprot:6322823-Prymnesium_polylepis.1